VAEAKREKRAIKASVAGAQGWQKQKFHVKLERSSSSRLPRTAVVASGPVARRAAAALILLAVACSGTAAPAATPRASPVATATPSTGPLRDPGPLHFSAQTIAEGLEAPWSLDFAKDGAIWLTERPGRVRVIRNGKLLPDPALTLNVVTASGCEDGLLGLAVREPYVYLYYTYRGSSGNTNRVSRFTIQGDKLASEQVLLDGIPGGTCYHFGGRMKFGPDGLLYLTTGEGFIASRATDPNNLSGKILRIHDDGSGREVFAWGFRNPQGLAFDSASRLYASNNGPTSDLGLCCHDEVDLVQQGGFYGWPEYAGNLRTSYPQGGLPAQRIGPVAESGNGVWAPSGMAFYAPAKDERPTLILAELRGQALQRFVFDASNPAHVTAQEVVFQGAGRMRDAVAGPDFCLYALTSNRDSRGSPRPGDDRLLKLCPSG
jgi:glucose/arabinose dehydrogenase